MNLFAFISYVVTNTFTPGPNNLMAMSNGLHTDFRRTLRFLGGVFCGFLLVMLICGFVNFALMTLIPSLRPWLNLPGAGYMLYLAFHVMTSSPHEENLDQSLNSFNAGLPMQFINPRVILYGITVFSNCILLASSARASFGVVFRTFFAKYDGIINLAMGVVLIYSAIASPGFSH